MAMSSDNAASQSPLLTYTYEEIQELLDSAGLQGWEEGVEEGLKMGKEKADESGQKMYKKGRRVGYKMGRKDGLDEGEKKPVGHGEGLCISKEAHIRELW
jgi:flagellar biosynthesis/type III secretory pathway protein FliH